MDYTTELIQVIIAAAENLSSMMNESAKIIICIKVYPNFVACGHLNMFQYQHPCTVRTSISSFGNLINKNIFIIKMLGFCHHNKVHATCFKREQNSNYP